MQLKLFIVVVAVPGVLAQVPRGPGPAPIMGYYPPDPNLIDDSPTTTISSTSSDNPPTTTTSSTSSDSYIPISSTSSSSTSSQTPSPTPTPSSPPSPLMETLGYAIDLADCGVQNATMIADSIREAVSMLTRARIRLRITRKWMTLNQTELRNSATYDEVATYYLWQTLYDNQMPSFTKAVSTSAWRGALGRMDDIINTIDNMLNNIDPIDPNHKPELLIFCSTKWMGIARNARNRGSWNRVFSDNRNQQFLTSQNGVGKDRRAWIETPVGKFRDYPGDPGPNRMIEVPHMPGSFRSVLSLNPNLLDMWEQMATSGRNLTDIHFALKGNSTPVPMHLQNMWLGQLSAELLFTFSLMEDITGIGYSRGFLANCSDPVAVLPHLPLTRANEVLSWDCAVEMGRTSRNYASYNSFTFVLLIVGLWLDARDWSTGVERSLEGLWVAPANSTTNMTAAALQ